MVQNNKKLKTETVNETVPKNVYRQTQSDIINLLALSTPHNLNWKWKRKCSGLIKNNKS